MLLDKIPATIVTGFLGSGKTTLLRHVLQQAQGKRIAVIVNEFGEMDIDAELIRSCPLSCEEDEGKASGQGIYELANGCICCTVEEEFLPVMKQLVERRDDIDHILIETSGLALPKPLVKAFNWPEVSRHCTVDAVIAVVDGEAIARGDVVHDVERVQAQRLADPSLDHEPSLRELLDDQLSSADMVVVSKVDLLTQSKREEALNNLRSQLSPGVSLVESEHAQVDTRLLIGLEAQSESKIDHVHNHHDHHHAHGHHHQHVHDFFDTCVLKAGEVSEDMIFEAVQSLVSTQAIYRLKGFVAIEGKPMRKVIHGVGQRVDGYFDRLWQPQEDRQTQLVCIGRHLDAHVLQTQLNKALEAVECTS